ncbi:hypothetical protein D3C87_295960 [compost metagenome]
MSTQSAESISILQQDVPATNLPKLETNNGFSEDRNNSHITKSKIEQIIDIQPTFLYKRDGLYGLL